MFFVVKYGEIGDAVMKGKIIDILEKYKKLNRISFSMPGHKNGKGIKSAWGENDVTELYDTDSLHHSEGAVREACKQISEIFSADMSLIMVNGSTGGIFTMLASVCKQGDKVLLSRISHMSVINACVILGLYPIFFEHKLYSRYSLYAEADVDDFKEKLEHNDIKAVLVTSPNYFGMVSDISRMSGMLKERKIPFLVDEAHGAHFFAGDFFPENAVSLGADMSVQSTHKTLNGLNQSAILHVKSDIVDFEKVKEVSAFFQTSSPSYPIAASAENAVIEIAENKEGWEKTFKKCSELKKELQKSTYIRIPQKKDGFFALDETRLVFNFSEYEITGYEVSDILREKYNIDIETADGINIVLIATPSNSENDLRLLKKALVEICSGLKRVQGRKNIETAPTIDKLEMTPSEAFYGEHEWIELGSCCGRISAGTVTVYPPGIPVLVPGGRISEKCIKYLEKSKGEITGMINNKVKVMKEGNVIERI